MTFSSMTLGKMGKMGKCEKRKNVMLNVTFLDMLSVAFSIVMKRVIRLSVVWLNVIMPSITMLSVIVVRIS